jgi:hypothetical protein
MCLSNTCLWFFGAAVHIAAPRANEYLVAGATDLAFGLSLAVGIQWEIRYPQYVDALFNILVSAGCALVFFVLSALDACMLMHFSRRHVAPGAPAHFHLAVRRLAVLLAAVELTLCNSAIAQYGPRLWSRRAPALVGAVCAGCLAVWALLEAAGEVAVATTRMALLAASAMGRALASAPSW